MKGWQDQQQFLLVILSSCRLAILSIENPNRQWPIKLLNQLEFSARVGEGRGLSKREETADGGAGDRGETRDS